MKTILMLLMLVSFTLCKANTEIESFQNDEKKEVKSEIDINQRLFTWEVKTSTGKAKGVSLTESDALKMIALFSKGDYPDFKIITSLPLN